MPNKLLVEKEKKRRKEARRPLSWMFNTN